MAKIEVEAEQRSCFLLEVSHVNAFKTEAFDFLSDTFERLWESLFAVTIVFTPIASKTKVRMMWNPVKARHTQYSLNKIIHFMFGLRQAPFCLSLKQFRIVQTSN